jgi:hypothetical protein
LTLFETYEASAEAAWAFRQVLRALAGAAASREPRPDGPQPTSARVEHPRSLTVVAFAGDQRAAATGPQLAVFAASLGITTRFVAATKHESVAALCAACAGHRGARVRPGLVLDVVGSGDVAPAKKGAPRPADDATPKPRNGARGGAPRPGGTQRGQPVNRGSRAPTPKVGKRAPKPVELLTPRSVDLTIVLTVADRGEPSLNNAPATAVTMLAVSPGLATREDLARLAVAVDDAGRRIDGVVVADRDPTDRTTGRRTLNQRAIQAPLPIRTTGPSRVSTSTGQGTTSR